MGKALFKVLILCPYTTDHGISFGEVLWFGLVLEETDCKVAPERWVFCNKWNSCIPNLKFIPFGLHGPFPI